MLRLPTKAITLDQQDIHSLTHRLAQKQACRDAATAASQERLHRDANNRQQCLSSLRGGLKIAVRVSDGPNRNRDHALTVPDLTRHTPQSALPSSFAQTTPLRQHCSLVSSPSPNKRSSDLTGFDSNNKHSPQAYSLDAGLDGTIDRAQTRQPDVSHTSNQMLYPKHNGHSPGTLDVRATRPKTGIACLDPSAPTFMPRIRCGATARGHTSDEIGLRRAKIEPEMRHEGRHRTHAKSRSVGWDPARSQARAMSVTKVQSHHGSGDHMEEEVRLQNFVFPSEASDVSLGKVQIVDVQVNRPNPIAGHYSPLPKGDLNAVVDVNRTPKLRPQFFLMKQHSSYSVPNLVTTGSLRPAIRTRHSSLNWQQNPPVTADLLLASSPESISTGPVDSSPPRTLPGPSSSAPSLLVATRSPLAELTDRLRYLAARSDDTNSPLSEPVTRTPERSRHLLSGALFYEDGRSRRPSYNTASHESRQAMTARDVPRTTIRRVHPSQANRQPHTEYTPHNVASGMDLYPSSDMSSSPLPPAYRNLVSPRAQRTTPRRHDEFSAVLPPTTASRMHQPASRVRIYDDEQPAALQPRTPADIGRPRERIPRRPEDLAIQHTALSAIRTRLRSHQDHVATGSTLPAQSSLSPPVAGIATTPRRANRASRSRTSDQENHFEPVLLGLDEEMRSLMHQRAASHLDTMETTPPRGGMLERYLR